MDQGVWQATVHGISELNTTERLSTAFNFFFSHTHALTSYTMSIIFSVPQMTDYSKSSKYIHFYLI